ncbi:MAG: hypothetical protein EON54_20580 [Alcaligenaceae bacterium]|nr:MAG: hypothetical protein EON54_20580 [Alcaligenaceae bacterium]
MTSIAGGGEQLVIYNSSDGPLLYLITLGEYIQTYGDRSILKDRFYHHPSRTTRTVGEAAHRCVQYIERVLSESPDGLYSVPNTNVLQTSPSGVMRDGSDAYVRSDGTPADYSRVAYIENQGLAHHALQMTAEVLFPDEQEARVRRTLAHNLRDAAIERFWMEDKSFFAAAIDRNGQIDMLSSAVFELLDSPFFEGVKGGGDYVEGLVRKLYDDESFMTPIGARMISLEQSYLEGDDYYSYQGSGVVWPVTNGIIANGLSRWSLQWLARDLGVRRLVGGIEQSRQAFELTYVHRLSNAPMYKPSNHKVGDDLKKVIYASDRAQPNQAWTASAGLRQLHRLAQPTESKSNNPHLELLDEYMAKKLLDGEMPTAIDSVPNKYFVTCDYDKGARLKSERAADLKGKKSRPREI